ncbi:RNA-directed DNA polymerase, partial [candidate division WOR-3 bacterium]|nr:RNA-directed DNA polymerase [candidate division WOR-3 bacterium]
WDSDDEYNELIEAFCAYENFRKTQPSIAVLNLNNFNNLCFNKICSRLNIEKKSKEYGVNLNANIIHDNFPKANRYWVEINAKRNQKTEAHPYDKYGKIRIKITQNELDKLHEKEIETLEEICNFRNY